MIQIEMLPAKHGDALLVTYGDGSDLHRILVDAGPSSAYTDDLATIVARQKPIDLVVVTHYDLDHIGGAIKMLKKPPASISKASVWFNGLAQMRKYLAPKQGDDLSKLLATSHLEWNPKSLFPKGAVAVPNGAKLPVISLPGDATVTLLSPGRAQVIALRDEWVAASKPPAGKKRRRMLAKRSPPGKIEPGMVPELAVDDPSKDDTSVANASSIAFILEHGGKKVLLAGDANPGALAGALEELGGGKRVKLDAVKLPHHGSRANVTRDWLKLVSADEYLVSTNGDQYGHPDPEGIARVVLQPGHKVLRFNYATDYTLPWSTTPLRKKFDCEAHVGGVEGGTAKF